MHRRRQLRPHRTDLFDQDDEGTVKLLNPAPDPSRHDAVREAEDLCPSGAISITEQG